MPRIVLIGAGHAHLGVIRGAAALVERGAEVLVVAPEPFWYSGLATGVLAGQYDPALDVIDVERLAARAGARVVCGRAVALELAARRIVLESGERLAYDLVSLDVGSQVPADVVPGAARHAVAVKPVSNLARLRGGLEARWARGERPRVVVAGGGRSGCEVAAAIARLAAGHGAHDAVALVAGSARLAPDLPAAAGRRLHATLVRRGVRCRTGVRVVAVEPGRACTDAGEPEPFDVLVLATGLVPPPLARDSGLPIDDAGALIVDATLRAAGCPVVFGGGDCVAVGGRALPRIGVHAVRQAPVLLANLAASLAGAPLRRYRPQRRALLIMNLGDGTGLATWGPFTWQGRAAFRLKDRIDRRWLAAVRA